MDKQHNRKDQDLNYGGFWRRFAAFNIDAFLITLATTPNKIAFSLTDLSSVNDVITLIFGWCIVAYFLSSNWMATPGKRLAGLVVVHYKIHRISFLRALGRSMATLLSAIFIFMGVSMCVFDKKRRCLHDYIAGTIVAAHKKPHVLFIPLSILSIIGHIVIVIILIPFLIFGNASSGLFSEWGNTKTSSQIPTDNKDAFEIISHQNDVTSLESLITIGKNPDTRPGGSSKTGKYLGCDFPIQLISQTALEYDLLPKVTVTSAVDRNGRDISDSKHDSKIESFFDELFIRVYVETKSRCTDIYAIKGKIAFTPPSSIKKITLNLTEGEYSFVSDDGNINIEYSRDEQTMYVNNIAELYIEHSITHSFKEHPIVVFIDENYANIKSTASGTSSIGEIKTVSKSLSSEPSSVLIYSIDSFGQTLEFPLEFQLKNDSAYDSTPINF